MVPGKHISAVYLDESSPKSSGSSAEKRYEEVNVNIVVFAFDKNLANALENLCDVVEYISNDTEDFCEYGTNDSYKAKDDMNLKA